MILRRQLDDELSLPLFTCAVSKQKLADVSSPPPLPSNLDP